MWMNEVKTITMLMKVLQQALVYEITTVTFIHENIKILIKQRIIYCTSSLSEHYSALVSNISGNLSHSLIA